MTLVTHRSCAFDFPPYQHSATRAAKPLFHRSLLYKWWVYWCCSPPTTRVQTVIILKQRILWISGFRETPLGQLCVWDGKENISHSVSASAPGGSWTTLLSFVLNAAGCQHSLVHRERFCFPLDLTLLHVLHPQLWCAAEDQGHKKRGGL